MKPLGIRDMPLCKADSVSPRSGTVDNAYAQNGFALAINGPQDIEIVLDAVRFCQHKNGMPEIADTFKRLPYKEVLFFRWLVTVIYPRLLTE